MLARRKTHARTPQEIAEALEFSHGHPAAAARLLGVEPWIVRNAMRSDPALAQWQKAANRTRRLKFRLGPIPEGARRAARKPDWPDFADRRLAVLIRAVGKKETQRVLEDHLSGPSGAQSGEGSETWTDEEKRVHGALERSNGYRTDAARELKLSVRRLKDIIYRNPELRRRWAMQAGMRDLVTAGAVRTMIKLPFLLDPILERLANVRGELLGLRRAGVFDERRATLVKEEADLAVQLCAAMKLQIRLNRTVVDEMVRLAEESKARPERHHKHDERAQE